MDLGKGLATKTPWIAILDKDITTSTREGVYIVFLFSSDYKHIYLTLNQGYHYSRSIWIQIEQNDSNK